MFEVWLNSSYNSLDFLRYNLSYNMEKMNEIIPFFEKKFKKWPTKDLIFCLFFMWIYSDDLGYYVESMLIDKINSKKTKNKLKIFFLRFERFFKRWTH